MISIAPKRYFKLRGEDYIPGQQECAIAQSVRCAGCFSPDAPDPRNYGQETRDILQAQIDLAPELFGVESQYQPQYATLALQNLNALLGGTPATTRSYNTTTQQQTPAGWYDAAGNLVTGDRNAYSYFSPQFAQRVGATAGQAVPAGYTWRNAGTRPVTTTNTENVPAQQGLFDLLRNQATLQRTADVGDVAALGPAAREAILAANPDQAALLQRLNAQAVSQLEAGSQLTPEEARQMQQASRAAFAARGTGGSNPAIADELLQQFNLGQQLLRQREAFAGNVVGLNQAVVGDPFQQILGRPSTATAAGMQLLDQSGPSIFNPESSYGGNLYNANQQMAAMFADPSTLSKIGSISNIAGSFLGGIAGGMF